jgi:hypothetical protein
MRRRLGDENKSLFKKPDPLISSASLHFLMKTVELGIHSARETPAATEAFSSMR